MESVYREDDANGEEIIRILSAAENGFSGSNECCALPMATITRELLAAIHLTAARCPLWKGWNLPMNNATGFRLLFGGEPLGGSDGCLLPPRVWKGWKRPMKRETGFFFAAILPDLAA